MPVKKITAWKMKSAGENKRDNKKSTKYEAYNYNENDYGHFNIVSNKLFKNCKCAILST